MDLIGKGIKGLSVNKVTRTMAYSPYRKGKSPLGGPDAGESGYRMSLHRVLLVEDDFDDQLFAKRELMQTRGVGKLNCFSNGKALFQYLYEQIDTDKEFLHLAPIIIVLDLDMPLMNGFEVLRTLKNHPLFKEIKVIVVTGEQAPWDIERALGYKADAVFSKPLDINKLRGFFDNGGHPWPWEGLWH